MFDGMGELEPLSRELERIRESGILGDARLRRLFEYLASNSLRGQVPKEMAIAIDVFGKGAGFDVSQDALVRVYIHKLRRTLSDYYAKAPGASLHIPRGEYRLALKLAQPPEAVPSAAPTRQAPAPATAPAPAPPTPPASPPAGPRGTRPPWPALAAATLLGILIGAGVLWLQTPRPVSAQIRTSPVWSWLQKDDRPTLIVIGDYYLVGETDDSMEVKRLIREYSVNSKGDLDRYIQEHPKTADRYIDVGLRYIPTSVAFALRDIMPILTVDGRRIGVSMMSDITANTFKTANIVYIGYLSGMGIMKDWIFAGSRFAIGDSYDELNDTVSKHRYISQTASQNMGEPRNSGAESPYRDYGFFSIFHGPGGNTVVVISGTRDEGVRQTAEMFTNPTKLNDELRQSDLAPPSEALVEVTALDGVNLTGKVLVSAKRGIPPGRSP